MWYVPVTGHIMGTGERPPKSFITWSWDVAEGQAVEQPVGLRSDVRQHLSVTLHVFRSSLILSWVLRN